MKSEEEVLFKTEGEKPQVSVESELK